ncbi:hypothetical protein [Pseudomonas sp. 210_17 TE3656]
MIRSPHLHLCGSLRHSFASALGLPSWVASDSSSGLLSVLRELDDEGVSVLLVIDDIDAFLLGSASKYAESCDFICYISKTIKSLKVFGTFSRLERIDTLANDLAFSRYRILKLSSWSVASGFVDFVGYVAITFGIKKHQVSKEDFLRDLFQLTSGATGSVIQTIKILGISGVLADGKIATPEDLASLWTY